MLKKTFRVFKVVAASGLLTALSFLGLGKSNQEKGYSIDTFADVLAIPTAHADVPGGPYPGPTGGPFPYPSGGPLDPFGPSTA